jgi:hypothetical protein
MEKFKLIDGQFSTEEAKEILTNIFSEKINFHLMKNFSSQERFGKDDEKATNRIHQLKEELDRLKEFLSKENPDSKTLTLNSEINISISEK